MKKIPKSEFKHRVTICSSDDVVLENGTPVLKRKSAYDCWAKIKDTKAQMVYRNGATIMEERDNRSHEIYINHRRDVQITSSAWVYEERLKSPPRWFKVLKHTDVDECGIYYKLICRLTDVADEICPPIEPEKETKQSAFKPVSGVLD